MPEGFGAHCLTWSGCLRAITVVTTLATAMCVTVASCGSSDNHPAASSPRPTPSPVASHTINAAPAPGATPAPKSSPSDPATDLGTEFTNLEQTLHAKMGIVITAIGPNPKPLVFGDWTVGPAWSTMKVPLTMTALREANSQTPTDLMRSAITNSDNAAAESIWEKLGDGDPVTAAHKVEAFLQKYGDSTPVESEKKRKEYTAFGQTQWPLTNQAQFIAAAVCDKADEPIFKLMGEVESDQQWGLGGIPGTQFKGGWGPSQAQAYLVRQIGVLRTSAGLTAVAVATEPSSGTFSDGTHDLDEVVAKWLKPHLAELPAGQCNH